MRIFTVTNYKSILICFFLISHWGILICQGWLLVFAIPVALSTEAILHSNNTRDMETDKKAGAVTLAIILGQQLSYVLYCLLLLAPYMICTVLSVNLSVRFLLPLITLRMAFKLERSFREGKLILLPQQPAKLNLMFGLLYTLSCSVAPLSLPR